MALIALILTFTVVHAFQPRHRELKFDDVQVSACATKVSYHAVPMAPAHVPFFIKADAKGVHECAELCYKKVKLCGGALFVKEENRCYFTYSHMPCSMAVDGKMPRDSGKTFVYCLECEDDFFAAATNRHRVNATAETPITSRQRPSIAALHHSELAALTSTPRIPKPTQQNKQQSRAPHASSTQTPAETSTQTETSTQHQINTATKINEESVIIVEADRFENSEKDQSNRPTGRKRPRLQPEFVLKTVPQTKEVDDFFIDKLSDFKLNYPHIARYLDLSVHRGWEAKQPANCSLHTLLPCSVGIGKDCSIEKDTSTGCYQCTCPHRSRSRGCLGSLYLPEPHREALLQGRTMCSFNHQRAQPVVRYYRVPNADFGLDDCAAMNYPYCGYFLDVNIDRMPRTKEECYYSCYSDEEYQLLTRRSRRVA